MLTSVGRILITTSTANTATRASSVLRHFSTLTPRTQKALPSNDYRNTYNENTTTNILTGDERTLIETFRALNLVTQILIDRTKLSKNVNSNLTPTLSSTFIGGGEVPVTNDSSAKGGGGLVALNRNARKPRRANHGARPCSRWGRRKRRSKYGKPKRKRA
mmetsp:Transcript_51990/g.62540  ORF Transcript_51990/g.62540 Transcript_51990/m.62540 type:complete len:161 (+) Transcript_51990:121-603(+)